MNCLNSSLIPHPSSLQKEVIMSLVKWKSPRELMPYFPNWVDNFFRDDDFFGSKWLREFTTPAVNVRETDATFDLEEAAPGIKKEDFKVEVKDGMLNISSESKSEKEEKDESYTRKEFSYTSFHRSFWLPETVKATEIKANYVDGLLKVTVPKMKVEKKETAKLIEIK